MHAGKVLAGGPKSIQRGAKLIPLWRVLGVVNHGECPAREGKSTIECLRFRSRADRRNGNDRDGDTMLARRDCRAGGMVIRLDCDDHVKFFKRIIQLFD